METMDYDSLLWSSNNDSNDEKQQQSSDAMLLEYATELAKSLTPRQRQPRRFRRRHHRRGRRKPNARTTTKRVVVLPRTVSLSPNQDSYERTIQSRLKKKKTTAAAVDASDFTRDNDEDEEEKEKDSDDSDDDSTTSNEDEHDAAVESNDGMDSDKDDRPTDVSSFHERSEDEESDATDSTNDESGASSSKANPKDFTDEDGFAYSYRNSATAHEERMLRKHKRKRAEQSRKRKSRKPKRRLEQRQVTIPLSSHAKNSEGVEADATDFSKDYRDTQPWKSTDFIDDSDSEASHVADATESEDSDGTSRSSRKTKQSYRAFADKQIYAKNSNTSGLLYNFGAESEMTLPKRKRKGSMNKPAYMGGNLLQQQKVKERRSHFSNSTVPTNGREESESDTGSSSDDYDVSPSDATDSSEDCATEDTAQRLHPAWKRPSTLTYDDGRSAMVAAVAASDQCGTDHAMKRPRKRRRLRKTKHLSQKERIRLKQNDAVKQRIERKEVRRIRFFSSNIEILKPFLDERVIESLEAFCGGSLSHEEMVSCSQPAAIQGEMRDYQLTGLNWMVKMHKSNLGMILGDEMGLGKTLQTIALLCYVKEREGISGPSIVLCPLSVLPSWCNELERWAPSLKFFRLHSSSAEELEAQKVEFRPKVSEYDVVLTTYEAAKSPRLRSLWSHHYFNYLVLDEGHRIKDVSTQNFRAARLIHCENILVLTGTPLQNNLVELWSILNFIYPDVFISKKPFAEAFDLTMNVIKKETLLQAHSLLSLFMLRRLKTEVEKSMPKKIETKVLCPLSKTQAFWYKALLMKDINMLVSAAADETETMNPKTRKELENLLMQLRKCCLHPFLFDGAEADSESTTCKELIAASGKLSVLDMLLRSLYKKQHRVVLFSQFTAVLDILQDYCTLRGYKHFRLDGKTARAKRNLLVNQFNAPGSDVFIFLMSTRAGGMGLNLQTADTCILFDNDWNPQPDIQAAARVHRIGQKKTVHVYRLVVGGTIEERMVERAQKKLYLDQMVNQDAAAGADQELRLSKGELLSTIKFGCDAVFGEDGDHLTLPTDHDIEIITDRNRSETFSNGRLKGGATNTASDFEADEQFTSTMKLDGIDFKVIRDQHRKHRNKSTAKDLDYISNTWMQSEMESQTSANEQENGEGTTRKTPTSDFDSQEFCQMCGGGGLLLCCSRCPISVHKECVNVTNPDGRWSCPHHRCSKCQRTAYGAGGLLFPCQSCPLSFCEDCLPTNEKGFRVLDKCDRFEKLGFASHLLCYIHCSENCEEVAEKEFGWCPPCSMKRAPTPPPLDLSYAFAGSEIQKAESSKDGTHARTLHSLPEKPDVDMKEIEEVSEGKGQTTNEQQQGTPAQPEAPLPATRTQKQLVQAPVRTDRVEYEVLFPWTKTGYLFEVRNKEDSAVFGKYTRDADGRKGPAEIDNHVRGEGDRIIAVNQVDVHEYSFNQVVRILRKRRREKSPIVVRFLEANCTRSSNH